MNVEIGAEAALFPEKEYINGIAIAVQYTVISRVEDWSNFRERGLYRVRALIDKGFSPHHTGLYIFFCL
jgi:hypothetical protein